MKNVVFILSVLFFLISCMPEENLPVRNMGETPEYFIECYCQPGHIFALSATTILPVAEDLKIDFFQEMEIKILANQEISLTHSFFTLPGSDFIYNYGSEELFHPFSLDSLYLSVRPANGKIIHASTAIPEAVNIYDCEWVGTEAIVRFQLSEKPENNFYIYSAEAIRHSSIIDKEVCYIDYNEHPAKLAKKSLFLTKAAEAEKILFSLKRITRANYEYQISLNAANTANQSSITTPVPLKGNISGALGIFTSYTEDRAEIRISE